MEREEQQIRELEEELFQQIAPQLKGEPTREVILPVEIDESGGAVKRRAFIETTPQRNQFMTVGENQVNDKGIMTFYRASFDYHTGRRIDGHDLTDPSRRVFRMSDPILQNIVETLRGDLQQATDFMEDTIVPPREQIKSFSRNIVQKTGSDEPHFVGLIEVSDTRTYSANIFQANDGAKILTVDDDANADPHHAFPSGDYLIHTGETIRYDVVNGVYVPHGRLLTGRDLSAEDIHKINAAVTLNGFLK